MYSINKIILQGRAGGDAEAKETKSQDKMARFSLVTDEFKKNGDEWETIPTWHSIVCFKYEAERALAKVVKGAVVYVEGRLQSRKHEDKTYWSVIADKINVHNPDGRAQQQKQVAATSPLKDQQAPQELDDDLPF